MPTAQHPIDKAAATLYGGSRRQLAQAIDEDEAFLGKIARGEKPTPPALAARLAAITGDDPTATALDALSMQEKDPKKRDELRRLFKLAAAQSSAIAVAVSLLALGSAPNDARATTDAADRSGFVYYVNWLRHVLRMIQRKRDRLCASDIGPCALA